MLGRSSSVVDPRTRKTEYTQEGVPHETIKGWIVRKYRRERERERDQRGGYLLKKVR